LIDTFIHIPDETFSLYLPAVEHQRTLAGTHFPVPLWVGG